MTRTGLVDWDSALFVGSSSMPLMRGLDADAAADCCPSWYIFSQRSRSSGEALESSGSSNDNDVDDNDDVVIFVADDEDSVSKSRR